MTTKPGALKGRSALGRWSTWRQIVQGAFLAWALIASMRHLILADGGSIEASCPFGAVETAWSRLASGTFLRHLAPSNVVGARLGTYLLRLGLPHRHASGRPGGADAPAYGPRGRAAPPLAQEG